MPSTGAIQLWWTSLLSIAKEVTFEAEGVSWLVEGLSVVRYAPRPHLLHWPRHDHLGVVTGGDVTGEG